MIGKAIRYEIIKAIPELDGSIFPTNAPKTHPKPYLVYYLEEETNIKTLEGYGSECMSSYMLSIMTDSYLEMQALCKKILDCIYSFSCRGIGKEETYIEDITITSRHEQYEHEIAKHRGIITFNIYY